MSFEVYDFLVTCAICRKKCVLWQKKHFIMSDITKIFVPL